MTLISTEGHSVRISFNISHLNASELCIAENGLQMRFKRIKRKTVSCYVYLQSVRVNRCTRRKGVKETLTPRQKKNCFEKGAKTKKLCNKK